VLCVGGCGVFCDGLFLAAGACFEAEKVCCVVDCREYSFPLQVCTTKEGMLMGVVLLRYRVLSRISST
jgi:hypothetical protein